MHIGDVEKPGFESFKEMFINQIKDKFNLGGADREMFWQGLDQSQRKEFIQLFVAELEKKYGLEVVLDSAVEQKVSLESAIIDLYHTFSTMFLVESINCKIRASSLKYN